MGCMELILEIRNGTFSYGEQCAIDHIDIKIYQGEKIAVVGNNGAGKSTFFLILNGVSRLDEGEVLYHGQVVDYKRKSLLNLRKNVGMVFQDPDHQMIASTVEGEISFGLFNIGLEKEEIRKRVDAVMDETGLTALAQRPPHFLSGGEKKQVSIADIVVMNPRIILFDEPTASLDGRNINILKKQLAKLHQEQMTLVVSTHDMNFVWEWADRVIVFSNGKIIADNTPTAVFQDEELLQRASLRKPILYEVAEAMKMGNASSGYPKTLEEWKERLHKT